MHCNIEKRKNPNPNHISLHDVGSLLFTRRRMDIILNTTQIHTGKNKYILNIVINNCIFWI